MTFRPPVGPSKPVGEPDALPESADYETQTVFLPFEKVGDFWVGGDWCGGTRASDGSLWVIIADVTGHGYSAYLLACNMPHVWGACWEAAPFHDCPPVVLMEGVHRLLEDCLPEGVYVEGTLARLKPDGEVTIAPAGGTRLLLRRRHDDHTTWHRLSGSWLGLAPPQSEDQRTWLLDTEDQLLLGTDGFFDQIAAVVPSGDPCLDLLANRGGSGTLFDAVQYLLQEGLRTHPQVDDITMVLLRRR
jgi:serine phosphatase RsbU (regulator of sigma subunit)